MPFIAAGLFEGSSISFAKRSVLFFSALSSPGEGGVNPAVEEDAIGQNDSSSVSEGSEKDTKEATMMSTMESLEGTTNRNNG